MHSQPLLLASALTGGLGIAQAGSLPIQIDGRFEDWSQEAAFASDPAGDGGGSGVDFRFLFASNDLDWLFLRFDTTVEIQPDENQAVRLYLDTDENPATGLAFGTLGAELVWEMGNRFGRYYFAGGGSRVVEHADVGFVVGPTVSGEDFEIALSRHALVNGVALFPGPAVTIACSDGTSGDVAPNEGGMRVVFDATPQPVPPLETGRADPGHVRIATYNVLSDGLFSGGAKGQAFGRIFAAIDPDVWILNEVWDGTAAQTQGRVEQLLPSGPGETWSAVKRDEGNVIVSRFPVLQTWSVLPGSRLTAALLDLRPGQDSDLLVVDNHWSCCTADDNRQEQADALVAFLRDARTPGGRIDLASDTPVVLAGDLNLVGFRRQIDTLLWGDIADNARWGEDSPPDWDGTALEEANSRHPDARFVYTWRRDSSDFYPGKLDWMIYTGSVLEIHNHFVLETRTMRPERLLAMGLLASDTPTASDHASHVADFSLRSPTSVLPVRPSGPFGLLLRANVPNPFSAATTIRFSLQAPGRITLEVFDLAGRLVRRILDEALLSEGDHVAGWDGHDDAGRPAPSGVYFLNARPGSQAIRMLLVR